MVAITPTPSEPVAVVTPASPSRTFTVGERFVGTYQCIQGLTDLSFEITAVYDRHRVDATFSFNHVPSGADGAYRMTGLFEPESRRALFTPLAWLRQPDGYVMVGMDGVLSDDGKRFSGRIAFDGCGDFSVVNGGAAGSRAGAEAPKRGD